MHNKYGVAPFQSRVQPHRALTRSRSTVAGAASALLLTAALVHGEPAQAMVLSSQPGSVAVTVPSLDHRERTILHYGVTTEADIAKCKEDWGNKPVDDRYRGYDYPCPTFVITPDDFAAAQRHQHAIDNGSSSVANVAVYRFVATLNSLGGTGLSS